MDLGPKRLEDFTHSGLLGEGLVDELIKEVVGEPTPITPATDPSASRTGEYHASNTTPNTSTTDEKVSPPSARRTSAA